HSCPSLALNRTGLWDFPYDLSRLNIERSKVLLAGLHLWAILIPFARRNARNALLKRHQVIETCRGAEGGCIPVGCIFRAAYTFFRQQLGAAVGANPTCPCHLDEVLG